MKKRIKPIIASTLALSMAIAAPVPSVLAAEPHQAAAPASAESTAVKWVPLRAIAEALGATVGWEDETRTVTLTRADTSVSFSYLNLGEAKVDGASADLSASVKLDGDTTMVALDALNGWFGSRVDWESGKLTIAPDDHVSRAYAFVTALNRGDSASAHASLSPAMASTVTPELLQSVWTGNFTAFGRVKSVSQPTLSENAVHRNVKFVYKTELMASLELTVRFDEAGFVDDLYIARIAEGSPEYRSPEYEKPGSFTEEEIVIGEGPMRLPGTLTMPVGEGPFPAVVLVHGSGPNDRDMTVGGSRLFRDLAVGLASRGIAVVRYDKVTYEHSFKSGTLPNFTIQQETADDALAAVRLLAGDDRVDPERIYIIGHSQGGFMVPRMLELDTEGRIAGAVLLAGPSSSFQDVLLEQNEELLRRFEQLRLPTDSIKQNVELAKDIVDTIKNPQYDKDNLPADFPLQPAYWWFEMRDFVPMNVAAGQSAPLLIVQGGNDWQVPVRQFEDWKKALKDRTNVTYKLYPNMNHLLYDFDGISIGNEYGGAFNVSSELIGDIADWIESDPS